MSCFLPMVARSLIMTLHYYDTSTGTPHHSKSKKHPGDLTATRMYTTELQPDVEQAVEEDFRLHCCVADTTEFLRRLLPVEPATIQKIFQKMKDDKKYDTQSQRWAGFPDPNPNFKENSLYGPFNAIAEAIRQAAENLRTGTATEAGPTMWADYHSRSPSTQDSQPAQLRPDILFALRFLAEHSSKVRTALLTSFPC